MTTEVKGMKDTLEKVEEIFQNTEDTNNRVGVLELALEELRIIYERLDSSLATNKVRTLTFLGAGLALLSYLYAGAEDLFIPKENYGMVFYFMGLAMVLSGIGLLLRSIKSMSWSVPIETKITKICRPSTRQELLELLVEEYIESMSANIVKYEKKVTYLNNGFFLLLCGGILLLVIKNIGG